MDKLLFENTAPQSRSNLFIQNLSTMSRKPMTRSILLAPIYFEQGPVGREQNKQYLSPQRKRSKSPLLGVLTPHSVDPLRLCLTSTFSSLHSTLSFPSLSRVNLVLTSRCKGQKPGHKGQLTSSKMSTSLPFRNRRETILKGKRSFAFCLLEIFPDFGT